MCSGTSGVDCDQLTYNQYMPRPSNHGESSDEDLDDDEERSEDDLSQEDGDAISDTEAPSNKRRKTEGHAPRKRRRTDKDVR